MLSVCSVVKLFFKKGMAVTNRRIEEILTQIASLLEIKGENVFKVRATLAPCLAFCEAHPMITSSIRPGSTPSRSDADAKLCVCGAGPDSPMREASPTAWVRGYGAAGSASAWHAEGQGFESP
jgi:hypothetical protein